MSEPATLPATKHYRGDIWDDGYRQFGPISIDGSPPAAPCLYCRMQFRDKKGNLGFELNNDPGPTQGTIDIDDAANYSFSIPDQALPLAAGVWYWDFETYTTIDHSDAPKTWWKSQITIIEDVSRDD